MSEAILLQNRAYWTRRACGYSQVNREELATSQRETWKRTLCAHLSSHFGRTALSGLRVLDAGTGPGFFAILLAEAGCRMTGIDLTRAMLAEARTNAGVLAGKIEFLEMNAQELAFESGSFDAVVTRNLTWNLPDPERAYREWVRVLRPGGLLLNFDANWYHYLFMEDARRGFLRDRANTSASGLDDMNLGEGFEQMEGIAREVPLSRIQRPQWDADVLRGLGIKVKTDEQIWKKVWSPQEKVNFSSTPLFLVHAAKPE